MAQWASDYPPLPDHLDGGRRRSPVAALAVALSPGRIAAALLASLVMAGLLHWGAAPRQPTPLPAVRPEVPALEAPAWVAVSRPIAMFAVDTPQFPREARALEARRHSAGGGREEIHRLGGPDDPAGQARIVLYRPGTEAGAPGSFFLEVARRAAEAGLAVERSAVPTPVATKFGPVEAADVVLAGAPRPLACLAWRWASDDGALRMAGWACGTEQRPADRAWLACLIDRIDVVAAGDDRTVRALFAAADRHRLPQCRPAPRRSALLDPVADTAPRLRGGA